MNMKKTIAAILKRLGGAALLLIGALIAIAFGSLLGEVLLDDVLLPQEIEVAEYVLGFAALLAYFFGLLTWTGRRRRRKAEREIAKATAATAAQLLSPSADSRPPEATSQARFNEEALNKQYRLLQDQATEAFRACKAAMYAGFFVVLIAAAVAIWGEINQANLVAILSAISGVLAEFIAVIFFVFHRNAQDRLGQARKELNDSKRLLLALEQIERLEVEDERSKMRLEVVQSLLGVEHPVLRMEDQTPSAPATAH